MQSRDIITAALNADHTVTPAHKKRILAAIEGKPKRPDKQLTTKQACELLEGIHPITMGRLEKRGHLTPIRYSKRKIRWRESELLEFLESGITRGEVG
jgi:hypothetical protein